LWEAQRTSQNGHDALERSHQGLLLFLAGYSEKAGQFGYAVLGRG
jgi:hypothetical protein